ncbi:beta-ketoacyl synthase N-terminal-like domain-containing protein [Chryseolinea sp. T2]|uniref:beta-ketoacyl-[acyl-carrier-protein] synthase family protein n=1 Tax=Chryseolinea sp. T2 TaxID=3129255 RepID=UPI00307855D1
MKRATWIVADNIISPLGYTSAENFDNIISGKTGIAGVRDSDLSSEPFYASRMEHVNDASGLTRLETITIQAVDDIIQQTGVKPGKSVFILSTTKGNISFLEKGMANHPRIHLPAMAQFISGKFGFRRSLVVSNACISGVMALLVAQRIIQSGEVDHAVVAGVDVLSKFIVSGFQTLQAMSTEPCRPFDAARKGINLGEAAAAIVLSANPSELRNNENIRIAGGGLSNDANHISGPSRTGAELAFAIHQAMEEAQIQRADIDFISAHGTATIYNDEMEAKAFALAELTDRPIHSLKGYYGHTLGAAGVVEVALNAESLRRNVLLPSRGYEHLGVSQPLNIITSVTPQALNVCLKTASGFGGCNAAIILSKENYN